MDKHADLRDIDTLYELCELHMCCIYRVVVMGLDGKKNKKPVIKFKLGKASLLFTGEIE